MPTLLIVPGLRDAVAAHWQSHLAAAHPGAVAVAPMGRTQIDCAQRVAAVEAAARSIDGPFVVVAHSAGCLTVAHWALRTRCRPAGALLAAPADLETPMPAGYPGVAELAAAGWLPVPRAALPFAAVVGASRNDPLARFERVEALARDWGAALVDLGEVGHLNPASGFGPWPRGDDLIEMLCALA